jgi:DNA-binding MarR family transcriptional regulator
MRTNQKGDGGGRGTGGQARAGERELAAAIEAWSRTFQDMGSELYERAFALQGMASLTLVQFRYFELVARSPGITPAELAERMGVRRATVAGVVAAFLRQGLVRKQRSETDGRVSHLHLTEAARRIVEYRRQMYRAAARHVASVTSPAERRELVRIMGKAVKHD